MQLSEVLKKVDQLSISVHQLRTANDEREKQISYKGFADPLTEQKMLKLNNEIDEHKGKIANLELAISRPQISQEFHAQEDFGHKSIFEKYLRKGIDPTGSAYEQKDLSASSSPDGGYLLYPQMSNSISKHVVDHSVMRKLCSIETISTDTLDVIEDFETPEAGWVAEIEERKITKTPQIFRRSIKVHELYAQPKATQKLIDDSNIDISKWLSEKISTHFAASENYAFIHGDGVNKPVGILFAAANKERKIEQMHTAKKELTSDDIINLYFSLKSEYSKDASFLMHRNTLQQIRTLKCPTTSRYIWSPGLGVGAPDTLLGAGIFECVDMPVPASGAAIIAIADFAKAYKIVDRSGIRIIRDPYTEKPFVKFYTTKRVGGDVINPHAIRLLKLP